jgi:hypothetical protein
MARAIDNIPDCCNDESGFIELDPMTALARQQGRARENTADHEHG